MKVDKLLRERLLAARTTLRAKHPTYRPKAIKRLAHTLVELQISVPYSTEDQATTQSEEPTVQQPAFNKAKGQRISELVTQPKYQKLFRGGPTKKNKVRGPLDLTDSLGRTLLHHAANQGNLKEVKSLISQGANYTIRDNARQTPYLVAVTEGKTNVAEYLAKLPQTF